MYPLAKPAASSSPLAESGMPVAISAAPLLKLYLSSACTVTAMLKWGWPAMSVTVTSPLSQIT